MSNGIDLKFLSIMGSSNEKQKSNEKQTKSNGVVVKNDGVSSTSNVPHQNDVNDLNNGHIKQNVETKPHEDGPKKEKVYITRIFLAFLVLICGLSRVSLSIFCHFDPTNNSYIILSEEQPSQNQYSLSQKDDNDAFTNSLALIATQSDSLNPTSPTMQIQQNMCRSSHSVLDLIASIIHPYVNYDIILPKHTVHPKALPYISNNNNIGYNEEDDSKELDVFKKKNDKAVITYEVFNPVHSFVRYCHNIVKKLSNLFKKKSIHNEDSEEKETSKGSTIENTATKSNDDWTFYVSVPMELNLSSQQKRILEATANNFHQRLNKMQVNDDNDMDQVKGGSKAGVVSSRLKDMVWGASRTSVASTSWWFPVVDDWGAQKEIKGSRLLTSYLKIMKWPENLRTKFPFTSLCSDECPTDFAIAHTLEFRQKYKPNTITKAAYDENQKGWIYVRGYSPTRYHDDAYVGGSSVLWYRPGLYKINDPEPYFRALLQAIDTCVADALKRSDGRVGKCNVVLDAFGFGLSYIPPMAPIKKVLKMLQDHFPDKLGVFVIANMAKPAQIFLKMVSPFLPIEVRQKIHLLPSADDKQGRSSMMKELVDEEFIPTWLGGEDLYKFDAKEYYYNSRYKADFISDEEGLEYITSMPYHA